MKEVWGEIWTASSVYKLPSSVGNIWMQKKTIKLQQQNMFTIPCKKNKLEANVPDKCQMSIWTNFEATHEMKRRKEPIKKNT